MAIFSGYLKLSILNSGGKMHFLFGNLMYKSINKIILDCLLFYFLVKCTVNSIS